MYLVLSGILGAFGGVAAFSLLRAAGQLDLFISLGFLVLLGSVGTMMMIESVRSILKHRSGVVVRERLPHQHNWIHGLPMRVRFKKSRLYISVLPVLGIGLIIGFPRLGAWHRRRLHHGAGAGLSAARARVTSSLAPRCCRWWR
jgi:hypothetical protein